jgi:predicted small lipoprotein YifL
MKNIFIILTISVFIFSCGKKGPPGCEIQKSNTAKEINKPNYCQ